MKKIPMILCMLLIVIPSAHAVSVSINPAEINTVDTGSSFKAEIWVKGVTDLGSFQFDITFNTDIADAYSGNVVFGSFIGSTGRKAFFKLADDEIPGRLTCTVMTESPSLQGPDGNGILATITFQRQSLNDDFLNLENVHLTDTHGNEISQTPTGAEIKPRYHITADVRAGSGSISPSGDVPVKPGENQSFAVQPPSCYYTADVKMDGVSKNPPYTFSNINENHTIEAYFGIYQFSISASAGVGGSISPSGNIAVNCGSSQKFTIKPDGDYLIRDLKVDNVSLGRISEYTFPNVTSNHTIQAEFYISGDIDGNDVVDLRDAILTLQILCGITIDTQIYIDADVNGNNKIGIEEAAYVLQRVSKLR